MDVHGMMTCRVNDDKCQRMRAQLHSGQREWREEAKSQGVQLSQVQLHPNFSNDAFGNDNAIVLRNPQEKKLPLGADASVLKWRVQKCDDESMPLLVSCWPDVKHQGGTAVGCDVIIEYKLQRPGVTLERVTIAIPLSAVAGVGSQPSVRECSGSYTIKRGQLLWDVGIVDPDNANGSLEFYAPGCAPDDLFPLAVDFTSRHIYMPLVVENVASCEDDDEADDVKFSVESNLLVDSYTIN